jgi:hypothetical protein
MPHPATCYRLAAKISCEIYHKPLYVPNELRVHPNLRPMDMTFASVIVACRAWACGLHSIREDNVVKWRAVASETLM